MRARTGVECSPTVHDQPETLARKGRVGDGFGVGLIFRFRAPARAAGRRPDRAMYSCPVLLRVQGVQEAGSRRCRSIAVAQRPSALELDLVAAVPDPIKDRIGQRRVVEVGVPGLDRQLAGDQGRARADAVVQQFEQVVALGRADGRDPQNRR